MADKLITETEIMRVLGPECYIISYKDFANVANIDIFMKHIKYLVILYEWAQKKGHWCLLLKRGNILEFFDSFGIFPDDILNDVPNGIRIRFGMYLPMLTKLLFKSNFNLEYNNYKFQNEEYKTCGRWVIYRALRQDLNIDEFNELFNGVYNKDELIIKLTELYI